MVHLAYKDTNNKAFKPYYDKFKKMVKQDLDGDGWFLLVKDFPFKPEEKGQKFNPQIMFTAGEDIGKWPSKNLVSLYGKTNYIVGRCRKKGPVLTLLDFQEGDYVKTATESGLRKELKEYFKGTGVSVRVYKSLKVTEKEPEPTKEELAEEEVVVTAPEKDTETSSSVVEELEVPAPKPSSVQDTIRKAVAAAEKLGVDKEADFVELMTNFQKAVPRAPMMKIAINKLNAYFKGLDTAAAKPATGSSDLLEEKKRLQGLSNDLGKTVSQKLNALLASTEEEETHDLYDSQISLIEEAESLLTEMLNSHLSRITEIESTLQNT